ncbi:unnamed protein product [Arctogadus glacialis]
MLAALSTLDIRELTGVSPTPVVSPLEFVRGSTPRPAPPVVSSVACDARRNNTSSASSSRSSWLSGLRKAGAGRFTGLGVSSSSDLRGDSYCRSSECLRVCLCPRLRDRGDRRGERRLSALPSCVWPRTWLARRSRSPKAPIPRPPVRSHQSTSHRQTVVEEDVVEAGDEAEDVAGEKAEDRPEDVAGDRPEDVAGDRPEDVAEA